MHLEVINTGTELLIGDVINTNVAWLGQRLLELGIPIARAVTVPDGDAITAALAEACKRSDVVIVTGGLGPTDDDVSREAASSVFGVPLVLHDGAYATLEAYFAKRGRGVSEHNRRQAMQPQGATLLENPHGTAPGHLLPVSLGESQGLQCAVFLLPGPPRELKPMMKDIVEPILKSWIPAAVDRDILYLKFAGIGESEVSMTLQAEYEKIGDLEIGYCIGAGDVDVRLFGPQEKVAAAKAFAIEKLSDYLISTEGQLMEQVVIRLLRQQKLSLATAESCTGGFISSRLTDVSGSSEVFGYGFVTYANEAKTQLLGVAPELLQTHGAVSPQVAQAMAEGALQASGADHAIAVTGIAGPGPGTPEKPTGTVYIALASRGLPTEVRLRSYPGDRARFKTLTSQTALDFVRRRLSKIDLPAS